MSLAVLVAAALFVGVVVYGLLGGADFGTGFFDLTAGGADRGAAVRTQVDDSIGPVWEANHVWLIYVLVTWWTAFPSTFAAATTTLYIPFLLALLGIVLRGAAFAFRKYSGTLGQARLFGAVFAGSSLLAPFFLGAIAGAIASGRVPAEGYGDRWSSWVTATSLFGGAIAVGTCSFLAGVFLTADAAHHDRHRLADTLRRRTLAVGLATGVLVFAALVPIHRDAPTLAHGLEDRGAMLIVLSGVAGVATLVLVLRRSYVAARVAAVLAVAAVLCGWGVGQYPWLLVDEVTIEAGAGADSSLIGLLVATGAAVVIVLPPLVWLFRSTQARAESGVGHRPVGARVGGRPEVDDG